LAVGKYTFYVKDAKEVKESLVVEVKNSLEGIEQATIALANARTASIYDLGEITVQWNTTSKAYKFMFIKGVKGTYAGNNLEITEVPKGINVQLGKYKGIFNAKNFNEFFGFYLDNYTGKCTPSDISITKGTVCKILCTEGFLPPYIYDTDNTDLVKRFINKYKGKETDPNYTLTLALIKKLEPLGLVKQSDKYPFLNNELAKLYLALKAADDALNGDLTKLKDLIASGDNCALLQAFWAINRSEVGESRLKSLLLPDRQKALKVIAQGTLTTSTIDDFYCGYGDGGEETVLKLLLSTPTGDQKAVLEYMNSTKVANKTIIARFIEKIDNSNFDDYMLILTDWVFKHYPPNETWDKILSRTDKNDRNLLLLGEFPLGNSLSSTDKDGKTYFNFQINTPFVRSVSKPNVDALDYMVVKFNKDFTIGGFLYKEGQVAVVPAMT
jgi:hypothetical protein